MPHKCSKTGFGPKYFPKSIYQWRGLIQQKLHDGRPGGEAARWTGRMGGRDGRAGFDGRGGRARWPGGMGELDVRTGNASFGCDSGGSVSYGKALGLSRYSFSDSVIFVCLVDF